MKDIYFFLPSIAPGGAERVVSILSNSLTSRGYNISIIVLNREKVAYSIDERVKIIEVGNGVHSNPKLNRYRIITDLLKLLKRNECTPIVLPFHPLCLKYAMFIKRFVNIKVIACERNDPYHLYNTEKLAHSVKRTYSKADYNVFQTTQARSFFKGYVDKKSVIIPNPVIQPAITWKGVVAKHRIITACRLEPQKNIMMAIDAIRMLVDEGWHDIVYDIYGQGSMQHALETYAEEIGVADCVSFRGVTPDILHEMSDSSVFVLSSDYEGISNSMLEALSIGMPVVCTECPIGGAAEMIQNGENGILVSVGNSKEMAQAISAIFSDEKRAIQMGKKAAAICDKYSVDRITDQWEAVICSI